MDTAWGIGFGTRKHVVQTIDDPLGFNDTSFQKQPLEIDTPEVF